jgi:ubiquinone/menaquinone biosynthesis C-methylase UbiE
MSPHTIPPEILSFYATGSESDRLTRGIGPLELARTQSLLSRHLPASPSTLYDIGSGPGAHAFWLAAQGHTVHMLDPIPKHLTQARTRAAATPHPLPLTITLGDARALPFPSASADALLLHGPLYHLCDRHDRLAALREARRVLRPGGLLLAFAITRPASTLLGLTTGWIFDPDYLSMCHTELTTGQHRRPPTWPRLFTTAYFHAVDELRDELLTAGLSHTTTLGIEGPVWTLPDFSTAWQDPERRQTLLTLAAEMEHDPVLSPHILALARNEPHADPYHSQASRSRTMPQ